MIAVGLLLAGCDRDPVPQAPATRPTPATTAPAGGVVLTIDGQAMSFQPAHLRIQEGASGLIVQLYTEDARMPRDADPPAAIVLTMGLDADTESDLDGQVWRFEKPDAGEFESAEGIFLRGGENQLQPMDVKVTFAGKPPVVTVSIEGWFVAPTTDAPARRVAVNGKFNAVVDKP